MAFISHHAYGGEPAILPQSRRKVLWGAVIALALAIMGAQLPWIGEMLKSADTNYDAVQTLSYQSFDGELRYARVRLDAPVGAPVEYYRIHADLARFETRWNKLLEHSWDARAHAGHYGLAAGVNGAMQNLQMRYFRRYGPQVMAATADAHQDLVREAQRQSTLALGTHFNLGRFLETLFRCYIASAILVAMLYMARIKLEGMLIWYEWWNIIRYSVIWPRMLLKYPRYVNPIEQAKRAYRAAKRLVGGLLATTISLAGAAIAHAGESRTDSIEASEQGNVLVLSVSEVPRTPDFIVVVSTGIESQKVAGNGFRVGGPTATWDVSTTFRNGINFDLSGTSEIGGTGAANEVDYCVSHAAAHLSEGVCYYDIQPIGSGHDMVSPWAQISGPLGRGWTGSLKVEGNILTGGPPGNNSYLITGAMSRSDELAQNVRLDQTLSAAYGEGPFHQQAGLIARWRGAFSSALNQHIRVDWFRWDLFTPVLGARDRYPTGSASVGIHYAF